MRRTSLHLHPFGRPSSALQLPSSASSTAPSAAGRSLPGRDREVARIRLLLRACRPRRRRERGFSGRREGLSTRPGVAGPSPPLSMWWTTRVGLPARPSSGMPTSLRPVSVLGTGPVRAGEVGVPAEAALTPGAPGPAAHAQGGATGALALAPARGSTGATAGRDPGPGTGGGHGPTAGPAAGPAVGPVTVAAGGTGGHRLEREVPLAPS